MCSVSLIRPGPGRLRVVMNRDEANERPTGLPPRCDTGPGLTRLRTVDVQGGGAWIGVNAVGLVACLLNRSVVGDSMPSQPSSQPSSRGALVPLALAGDRPTDLRRCIGQAAEGRAPFTLIAATPDESLILAWDGRELMDVPTSEVCCSSGLGDALVADARLRAWSLLTAGGATPPRQDAWHASRLADNPAAWVLMRRPGARTISRCVVTVDDQGISLSETAIHADGTDGASHRLHLDRQRVACG